ncbi:hypothetical protein AOQ84DRAFT_405098 [Glonium stellatum]|uniref:Uncharacterized protein n=1 Tax=Glonium stellatum TaxID=574774 RepID=A0A8E2JZ62_9PEZI|nr:hypothetical protein AOQ84DRAFT_405098 [Glonium stellatum]
MLQPLSNPMYDNSIIKRKTADSEPCRDTEGSQPKHPRLELRDAYAGSPSSSSASTPGRQTPDNQGLSNLGTTTADRQGLELQRVEQTQTVLPHIYNRKIVLAPPTPASTPASASAPAPAPASAPSAPPALPALPAPLVPAAAFTLPAPSVTYPHPAPPLNQISHAPDWCPTAPTAPPRYDLSQLPQRIAHQTQPAQQPGQLSQTRTAIFTNDISEEQARSIPLILHYARPIKYGEGGGVTSKDVMQTTTLRMCQSVDDFFARVSESIGDRTCSVIKGAVLELSTVGCAPWLPRFIPRGDTLGWRLFRDSIALDLQSVGNTIAQVSVKAYLEMPTVKNTGFYFGHGHNDQ